MKILDTLTKSLEWDVKKQLTIRYEAFNRQLEYLKSQNNQYLLMLYKAKWNDEKFRVLFALNSFYQIVLGPLSSSSKNISNTGLGGEVPILYGSR